MKALVTGLHRSGTSLAAALVAEVSGLTFLDDPEWAIFHPRMGLAYRDVPACRDELERFGIVKCPRMCEQLSCVLTDFPDARAVVVARDPRDVFASVAEAVAARHWTAFTMADHRRFGHEGSLWMGVARAYNAYADAALKAAQGHPERVAIVSYEALCRDADASAKRLSGLFGLEQVAELPVGFADQQLGPLRNKSPDDLSIRGVGRWRKDVSWAVSARIIDECGRSWGQLRSVSQP